MVAEVYVVEERFFSTAEVADRLGLSVFTVQRWLREGHLPAVNYGGKAGYRIAESDLMAFVANRKRRQSASKIAATLLDQSETADS